MVKCKVRFYTCIYYTCHIRECINTATYHSIVQEIRENVVLIYYIITYFIGKNI